MATLTDLHAASPLNADDGSRHTFTADTDLEIATFALDDVDADLGNIDTLEWVVQARMSGTLTGSDQYGFTICIRNAAGDTVLAGASSTYANRHQTVRALTSSAAAFPAVDTNFPPTGSTAFTYLDTSASEATWNAAIVEVQQLYAKDKGADGFSVQVDFVTFSGTYTASSGTIIPLIVHHMNQMRQ